MNTFPPRIAAAGVLAVLVVSTYPVAVRAAEPRPATYRINVQVVHSPDDRRTDVLSSPTVITLDRQQASIQVAKEQKVVIDGDEVIEIESGVTCRLTPYHLKDGSVKLDIETDVSFPPEGMPDVGVDLVTKRIGVRQIQKVALGKLIQIPITPKGEFPGYHLSLQITEVQDAAEPEFDGDDVFNFFISGGR